MSRIRFLMVSLALVLVLPYAHAQDSTALVKTFKVTPFNRMPAILAPNARIPEPPGPVEPGRKQDILHSIGGESAAPSANSTDAARETRLDHIVLSAREPFYEDKGYLTLTLPATFHPESVIAFDNNFSNILGVKLNVEKGGMYLVDFAVHATGAGAYKVDTESGGQTFEDSNSALEHVLIALSAEASGWTTVRMSRTGSGYNLYSVEVTRAN